jgi:hypothetical protein
MMALKQAGLLVLLVSMTACGSVQIDPPESQALVGTCQQLAQAAYLIERGRYIKGGLKGEYLIITEPFLKNHLDKIVGPLEKGTRLTVRRVVKDENMTASCWHIEVEVASGSSAGKISELPACYTGHPPTWLNSYGPSDVVEQLKILPEYAVPCGH